MITECKCKSAAFSLGYKSKNGYQVVNYAHLPHGCFVGHAHTDWTYTYYNSNKGVKNAAFKSICKNGKVSDWLWSYPVFFPNSKYRIIV